MKKTIPVILIALTISLLSGCTWLEDLFMGFIGTPISGTLGTQTIATGTYYVNDNITVTGALEINDGTTFLFKAGTGITVANGGSITATSTGGSDAATTINFSAPETGTTRGLWNGIVFQSGSSGSLTEVNFKNATTAVTAQGSATVTLNSCGFAYNTVDVDSSAITTGSFTNTTPSYTENGTNAL